MYILATKTRDVRFDPHDCALDPLLGNLLKYSIISGDAGTCVFCSHAVLEPWTAVEPRFLNGSLRENL